MNQKEQGKAEIAEIISQREGQYTHAVVRSELTLKEGDPCIRIRDRYLQEGIVEVNSLNMRDEEVARIVRERLHAVITG